MGDQADILTQDGFDEMAQGYDCRDSYDYPYDLAGRKIQVKTGKNRTKGTLFNKLVDEVMKNKNARTAIKENVVRRDIAGQLSKLVDKCRFDKRPHCLAKKLGISIRQLERVLHQDLGGKLHLRTLVTVADALGKELVVKLK